MIRTTYIGVHVIKQVEMSTNAALKMFPDPVINSVQECLELRMKCNWTIIGKKTSMYVFIDKPTTAYFKGVDSKHIPIFLNASFLEYFLQILRRIDKSAALTSSLMKMRTNDPKL